MSQKNTSDTIVPHRWILRINKILEKGPRDDRGAYVVPTSNYRDASLNPIPRVMLLVWVVASFLICLLYASAIAGSATQPLYYIPVIPVALVAYFVFDRRQISTFLVVLAGITTMLSVTTLLLLLRSEYLLIGLVATCINIYVFTRVVQTNNLLNGLGRVSNKSEWSQRNQENDTYLAQALPAMPRWWGTPGSSLSSSDLNQENVTIGQLGEKYTAQIIGTYIQRHPHAFTLHSVKWPGLEDADLDHILVVNRTILVIDSKKWQSNATYSFSATSNVVTRDGWEFSGGKIYLARAVQSVRDALSAQGFLGTYSVSGILVIHGQNISLAGQTHSDFVAITESGLSSLLENIGSNPAMTIDDRSVSEYIDPLTLLPALQLFLDVDNGLSPWNMNMVSRFSDGLSPTQDLSPIEIPEIEPVIPTPYNVNDEDDESFRNRLNVELATQLLGVRPDADIDEIRSAWEYKSSLNLTRFSDLNEEQLANIKKVKARTEESYLFLEEYYSELRRS